jgi:RNA polymerase sigma-70 factor (ECF subfamily)
MVRAVPARRLKPMTRRIRRAALSNNDEVDERLVARAATGDEGAFEQLVRRHTPRVWRLARSMLPDHFEAEEAVQDTFVKAYRALNSFRGEAAFGTWLIRICSRTCVDRLRVRRAPSEALDQATVESPAQGPVEVRLLVEEALSRLPPEERAAFVLVHMLEFTREEAAVVSGVPASTMRDRVARARQRLAAALAEQEVGGGVVAAD